MSRIKLNTVAVGQRNPEAELRRALQQEEFALLYQPKVSCATGQIIGVEALLRWRHPDRGLVCAQDFVPLLEETGLIVEVGNWALRTACGQAQAWHASGLGNLSVAVNLGSSQFYAEEFADLVRGALAHSGLDPALLELEITETLLMEDVQQAIAALARLKSIGIRLSVDNFGTGYSSLSYLKQFPLDSVKVDRSFVQDVTADANDASITRAVITMAHSLKLEVVALGVETEDQVDMLIGNRCDTIQGHYFSRPVPAEEIERMVRQDKRLACSRMEAPRPPTLLLVDDEENILSALKRLLRRDGYRILTASGGQEGLAILARDRVDVIVCDQRIAGMTGVEFLRRAKDLHPDTVRIVLSGYTELESITDAINEGAIYKFLTKPWEDENLRARIGEAFRSKEVVDENRQLHQEVQHSNRDLARANVAMQILLEEKQQRITRDETCLSVSQEIVQHLPWPVMGVDDDGMIALANVAAAQVFQPGAPLVGALAEEVLPQATLAVLAAPVGAWSQVEVRGQRYRARSQPMGNTSSCRGTLLLLAPVEEPA